MRDHTTVEAAVDFGGDSPDDARWVARVHSLHVPDPQPPRP